MVKKRLTKSQILTILQKYENGVPISKLLEEYGISQATFYNWKAKYGRCSFNNTLEIKKLKEENERLKRMFADLSLEIISLRSQIDNNDGNEI